MALDLVTSLFENLTWLERGRQDRGPSQTTPTAEVSHVGTPPGLIFGSSPKRGRSCHPPPAHPTCTCFLVNWSHLIDCPQCLDCGLLSLPPKPTLSWAALASNILTGFSTPISLISGTFLSQQYPTPLKPCHHFNYSLSPDPHILFLNHSLLFSLLRCLPGPPPFTVAHFPDYHPVWH